MKLTKILLVGTEIVPVYRKFKNNPNRNSKKLIRNEQKVTIHFEQEGKYIYAGAIFLIESCGARFLCNWTQGNIVRAVSISHSTGPTYIKADNRLVIIASTFKEEST